MSNKAMQEIPLEKIRPNPDQPRKHFDEAGLEELAKSIRQEGIIVPLLVRPIEDGYEIVHGERRWRAAKMAGLEKLPCDVREMDSEQAFRLSLLENVSRASLSAIEEAEAFEKLSANMTQTEIANLVGKSQGYVAQRLSLLSLPNEVQDMIITRVINPSVGRSLVTVDDKKAQIRLARQAAKGNLTTRDIEGEKIQIERARQGRILIQEEFGDLVQRCPELERYREAIEEDKIRFSIIGGQPKLVIDTLTKKFEGQDWDWPKFTGIKKIGKYLYQPEPLAQTFSENEWRELQQFDPAKALENLCFAGKEFFYISASEERFRCTGCAVHRRTYDPNYGRFIAAGNDRCELQYVDSHNILGVDLTSCFEGGPIFVKQGWGCWQTMEFNDGKSGRIRRSWFAHDFIIWTLIKQAAETIDPFSFSHTNFDRLNIFKVVPWQVGWHGWERKTVKREDMIDAFEKDLEKLRHTEPLTDEEFTEAVLDWLQNYTLTDPQEISRWRNGRQTYRRNDDGSVAD